MPRATASDGDFKNPWGLQRSSFQDLYCCVAKGSFFSVMGTVLLFRRLNIQNPSGLHDFWLQNSCWEHRWCERNFFFPASNSTLCKVFPQMLYEMKAKHTHVCVHIYVHVHHICMRMHTHIYVIYVHTHTSGIKKKSMKEIKSPGH